MLVEASVVRRRVVARVAARERFVHWGWQFPEVLEDGGFDVIVGNPPWMKVQWNEQGILSDLDARMDVQRLTAKQVADARAGHLGDVRARSAYLEEFASLSGLKALIRDVANFPLLQGIQTNLYKAFLCRAWSLLSDAGFGGAGSMVHQSGIFDDPKGGALRSAAYQRVSWTVLLKNQLRLFAGVHHETPYCFTVWGPPKRSPNLRLLCNTIHPRTLVESATHDGLGEVPGIRTAEGNWEVRGHRSRIIHVDEEALALFATLYDPPGTPAMEARLPVVHSQEILGVLRKLARAPRKLGDLHGQFYSTVCFDETYAQRDGIIRRETTTPTDIKAWVVSGPHFHVGNPFSKTANEGCSHNQDYSVVDLMAIPSDYLPRTNYVPACSADEYKSRTPHWDGVPVTGLYRHVNRTMVGPTSERTLIPALLAPGPGHLDLAFSVAMKDAAQLVMFNGLCASIPIDFFVKTTGKGHVRRDVLSLLPATPPKSEILSRALRLNALSRPYGPLWQELHRSLRGDSHTKTDPRLPDWSHLTPEWTWDSPLRSPYARRQALVELDALAALSLGLTKDELCLIYRVQFPVLFQYEQDTWYDQRGRIVFTNNRGLNGVGLTRAEWNELKGTTDGPLRFVGLADPPAWAKDALGPYEPPFDRCDREADMRQAYDVFVERGIEPAQHEMQSFDSYAASRSQTGPSDGASS